MLVRLYSPEHRHLDWANTLKTALAIQSVHTIVFDTCRVEGGIARDYGWDNPKRPCFLGMCCLYSAAVRLNEVSEDGLTPEEFGQLKCWLNEFSARWKIGGKLTSSTKRCISV